MPRRCREPRRSELPHENAPYKPLRTIVTSVHGKRPGFYEVLYEGAHWRARAKAGDVFQPEDEVEVIDRDGNVLIIRHFSGE